VTTADAFPADAFPAGHPLRFTTIAHAGLTILGPATPEDLEGLLDAAGPAATGEGTSALDIGCGKGDLLVRLALRGANAVGIDRNEAFLAKGRALAATAGVTQRVRLELADAGDGAVHDLINSGYDLVACVGASGAMGGPVIAPGRLAALARPGGWLLIGEGYWRHEPTMEQTADFGAAPGELVDLAGTLARMTDAGLETIAWRTAGVEAWDAYEDAYAGAVERWAAASPDDPDHDEFTARAAWFRSTWAEWRRGALGFVTVLLAVPARGDS
jgi:SAM-dependent methyltransferase